MNKFVAVAICAFAPVCLFGQVFRTDPNPTSTTGYAPPTAYPPVLAIPGAAIAICNDAACTTRTTTYTSASGSTTCPSTAQVVWAGTASCVANSDQHGNFGFWVNTGTYYYTVTVGGKQYGPYPLSVGGSGGGGGGNVSGSGTSNFTARWISNNTISTGALQDTGAQVGVGGAPDQLLTMTSPSSTGSVLHIVNSNPSGFGAIRFKNDSGTDAFTIGLNGSSGSGAPQLTYSQPLTLFPSGHDTIFSNGGGTGDLFRIYGTGGFNVASSAALATPSANFGRLWFDSTNLTFQAQNQSGSLSSMVFPKTCGAGLIVNGVDSTGNLSCISSGSGGSVTSVGLSLPGIFNVGGSPVTGSGVLTGTFINQTANTFFAGPSTGGLGSPGFRSMVLADLPSIASTNLSDSSTLVRNNTSNSYTSGSQDFTNAAHLVAKNGLAASKPATCAVGEVYFATDATAGQNWYFCTASNTWSPQAAGGTVTSTGTSGNVARFSSSTNVTNSLLQDNGTAVSIGSPLAGSQFSVSSNASGGTLLGIKNTTTTSSSALRLFDDSTGQMSFGVDNTANAGGHFGFLSASGLGGINFATDTGDYVFQNHAFNDDMFRIYGTGGFVTVPVAGVPGGAPVSGFGKFWLDSTSQTLQAEGSSGVASTTVVPNACAGQVVQSISSAGVITCGAGGGGGTANVPTVSISGATATFFSGCATGGCNVSEGGNQVQNFTATNTATAPASGTGSLYIYWAGTSGCQAILSGGGSAVTLAGSGPCSGVTSTSGTGFPNNATAVISRVDYASAAWTGFVNYQPTAANPPVITTGTGITPTLSPGAQQLAIDTSAVSIGIGTANFVPRWSGNSFTLATGSLQDNGTQIGVNCPPSGTATVQINGCSNVNNTAFWKLSNSSTGASAGAEIDVANSANAGAFGYTSTGSANPNAMYFFNPSGAIYFSPQTINSVIYPTSGGVIIAPTTVAALPGTCTAGQIFPVSDATSPTYGGTLTGGGSVYAIALCGPANTWKAH